MGDGHESLKSITPPQSLTPLGQRPRFVDLHDDFVCPYCMQVLQRPLQTDCGHLLCEECANVLIQEGRRCPGGDDDCVILSRTAPNENVMKDL